MTTYYVGVVSDVSLIHHNITSEKPVSLSTSKQKAKELAEKWLQKNTVNKSDYVFEGLVKINEDYCDLNYENDN